jgi:hypothetical protein
MPNPSESAKIRGSIQAEYSEKGDDMDVRLLLAVSEPSIGVPYISSMPINLISLGSAEGPVALRDCGKVAER